MPVIIPQSPLQRPKKKTGVPWLKGIALLGGLGAGAYGLGKLNNNFLSPFSQGVDKNLIDPISNFVKGWGKNPNNPAPPPAPVQDNPTAAAPDNANKINEYLQNNPPDPVGFQQDVGAINSPEFSNNFNNHLEGQSAAGDMLSNFSGGRAARENIFANNPANASQAPAALNNVSDLVSGIMPTSTKGQIGMIAAPVALGAGALGAGGKTLGKWLGRGISGDFIANALPSSWDNGARWGEKILPGNLAARTVGGAMSTAGTIASPALGYAAGKGVEKGLSRYIPTAAKYLKGLPGAAKFISAIGTPIVQQNIAQGDIERKMEEAIANPTFNKAVGDIGDHLNAFSNQPELTKPYLQALKDQGFLDKYLPILQRKGLNPEVTDKLVSLMKAHNIPLPQPAPGRMEQFAKGTADNAVPLMGGMALATGGPAVWGGATAAGIGNWAGGKLNDSFMGPARNEAAGNWLQEKAPTLINALDPEANLTPTQTSNYRPPMGGQSPVLDAVMAKARAGQNPQEPSFNPEADWAAQQQQIIKDRLHQDYTRNPFAIRPR